jgi:transposase
LSKVPPTLEALVSHRNARTTFHGRVVIVQRHRAGWPQAHIAKAMGISRKCVKTWLDRYASEGEAGLHDRSSRPHSCPRRTSKEMEQRIVELRQRERRGPDWIGAELGVAARTVSRVLIRHQVPRLCMLDPLTGAQNPRLEDHRGPLRTRQARRAGPHGRQETRPDPRWGRLARARPRAGRADAQRTSLAGRGR